MLTDNEIKKIVSPYIDVPEIMGLCLMGSYAAGDANDTSDLDIGIFFEDEAVTLPDLNWPCPHDLWIVDHKNREEWIEKGGWQASAFLSSTMLYDRSGDTKVILEKIIAAKNYSDELRFLKWDTYLNSLYRSLKYYRKEREYGFRACAAESVLKFMEALFFHNRLVEPLPGREDASLKHLHNRVITSDDEQIALLLSILRDGNPLAQAKLFSLTESFLNANDLKSVIDGWEGLIHLEINRLNRVL